MNEYVKDQIKKIGKIDYEAKETRLSIRMRNDFLDDLAAHCKQFGVTRTAFVKLAILNELERWNEKTR